MEPEKPFACTFSGCSKTFTNEDHLHVHTKKHDMVLQLGMEQKTAFVADQTPTPTRFIRNCEEVGLFLDLQNVNENPFEEGFKRAMETKGGLLSLENASTTTEDVLHTPHLVFPLEHGDCAHYTSNNHRNITISRSSSDESGAIKEYETTTISKLTNEVTTISRVVGKPDTIDRVTTDDVSIVRHGEMAVKSNETSVSVNNVIKIHSNVEIRKDLDKDKQKKQDVPPIMSQKSLDFVVDSLTNMQEEKQDGKSDKPTQEVSNEDIEVIIKLPNGKHVKMKAVDEEKTNKVNMKEKLKNVIANKKNPIQMPNVSTFPNILPLATGTLIPVTLVNPPLMANPAQKLPIPRLKNYETVKRKKSVVNSAKSDWSIQNNESKVSKSDKESESKCASSRKDSDSRCAASKRYRENLKLKMRRQCEENKQLREMNQWLLAEKAVLKLIITNHMKKCTMSDDLRNFQEKLLQKDQLLDKLQDK